MPSSSIVGTSALGFIALYSGVVLTPNCRPASMRSYSRLSSPQHHSTFWTLIELARPQIFSMTFPQFDTWLVDRGSWIVDRCTWYVARGTWYVTRKRFKPFFRATNNEQRTTYHEQRTTNHEPRSTMEAHQLPPESLFRMAPRGRP